MISPPAPLFLSLPTCRICRIAATGSSLACTPGPRSKNRRSCGSVWPREGRAGSPPKRISAQGELCQSLLTSRKQRGDFTAWVKVSPFVYLGEGGLRSLHSRGEPLDHFSGSVGGTPGVFQRPEAGVDKLRECINPQRNCTLPKIVSARAKTVVRLKKQRFDL